MISWRPASAPEQTNIPTVTALPTAKTLVNDPDESLDTDGDGNGNNEYTDDDNDGVLDGDDYAPPDPDVTEEPAG